MTRKKQVDCWVPWSIFVQDDEELKTQIDGLVATEWKEGKHYKYHEGLLMISCLGFREWCLDKAEENAKGDWRERADLYRHFNEDGELLYVGISMSALERSIAHRKKSHWWNEITRIEIEKFPTRAEALEAEKRAIRAENPKYNIDHNRGS